MRSDVVQTTATASWPVAVTARLRDATMTSEGDDVTAGSGNWTVVAGDGGAPLVEVIVVGSLVSVVIVGIVIGNAFVVASVAAFREMRTLTNWMIVSLASADLLVAFAVLPLSAYQVTSARSTP